MNIWFILLYRWDLHSHGAQAHENGFKHPVNVYRSCKLTFPMSRYKNGRINKIPVSKSCMNISSRIASLHCLQLIYILKSCAIHLPLLWVCVCVRLCNILYCLVLYIILWNAHLYLMLTNGEAKHSINSGQGRLLI